LDFPIKWGLHSIDDTNETTTVSVGDMFKIVVDEDEMHRISTDSGFHQPKMQQGTNLSPNSHKPDTPRHSEGCLNPSDRHE
jgi:hypothetical protein